MGARMSHAPHRTPIISPTLVGREREREAVDRLLGLALAGQGGALHVGGEAGVGKSRLAAEAAAMAEGRGFSVMRARCFEPDRALPYAALVDLLRAHLGPCAPEEVLAP